jgi:hypothetical protein
MAGLDCGEILSTTRPTTDEVAKTGLADVRVEEEER